MARRQQLSELKDHPPDGLSFLVCSEATFHYYVEAMKRLGIREVRCALPKLRHPDQQPSFVPGTIPVYSSHRSPLGILAACSKDGELLAIYDVPSK